ncbi:MAG: hypothetical protein RBS07_15820 [Lentimicrobium sp.]|jgi:hypothetical protein|nr:hypothetical protein [Lentimicrobium sp.]
MAFKKVDKEFCLSDNNPNVYGYRCLSEGFLADRFQPAIGFKMHKRDDGVAVRWEDIRISDGKVYGKPVVNIGRFPELYDEIVDGFYNGASCGKIVALEISDDPEMIVEGQTGPTVTKWFPREISIVDIPGNYSAFAQLYDDNDNVIRDLSDQTQINNQKNMNKLNLNAAQIAALNLSDDASESDISQALNKVIEKAGKFDAAQKELKDLKAADNKKQVSEILDKAQTERKLTKAAADKLAETYAENPTGLKDLVDNLTAQQLVTDTIDQTEVPAEYKGKSFKDLYLSGELEQVKEKFPKFYESLTKNK